MVKKILVTTALGLALVASNAQAGDIEVQLQQMQEQINALQKQVAALKAQQKTATLDGGVKVSMKPSPKIESADGAYSFQPFGRLHLDTAFFNDDNADHPDGSNFRRARLGFKGTVAEEWGYKAEIDFAGEGVAFKDVYASYHGFENVDLYAGHMKPVFGLEELTSSNYITFIERSAPTSTFVTGQQIGLQAKSGGTNWSLSGGVFNDDAGTQSSDDEAWSVAGRATVAPYIEDNKVVHLGVAATHRSPDRASDQVRFRSRAENNIASLRSVDTGNISAVDGTTLYGLEAAAKWNQFSLQGEYMHADVQREVTSDVDVNGWYVAGSWLITGESRPYSAKEGTFGRVKPHSPFSLKDGGTGAWELAVRYSNLDLNDGTAVTGGEMDSTTLALNWYVNNNVRLMFNYINADTDQNAVTADDNPNVFLGRVQVDF